MLGTFRDLLGATAKSPGDALLSRQLDERGPQRSACRRTCATRLEWPGPDASDSRGRFRQHATRQAARQKNAPKGLNENYGRELMELHTLGVDGGYTQKDVTEVARAFTGWTIQKPRLGGGFRFDPRLHDPGEKIVLGRVIKAGGGEGDGEQVLDILARHPSTARFIATKLVRRFVSDTPPPALVDRAAARFRADRRRSPRGDADDPDVAGIPRRPRPTRAKVKTPLEFVVSAVRATGAETCRTRMPLVRTLRSSACRSTAASRRPATRTPPTRG